MSSEQLDPTKKHRHDIGEIDHGPETASDITRGIQLILGAAIVFTAVVMVYALVVAGGAG